jgi:hypothetical protein
MNEAGLVRTGQEPQPDDEVVVQFGALRNLNIRTLEYAFENRTRSHTARINKSLLTPSRKDHNLEVTIRSYSAGIKRNGAGQDNNIQEQNYLYQHARYLSSKLD